jgi:hypothetical protein
VGTSSPGIVAAPGSRYTRAVSAQGIARSLAYINWTLLFALALGSFAALIVARGAGATRGYVLFTCACSALLGLLALASDLSLPDPTGLAITRSPDLDPVRRVGLAVFCGGALGYLVSAARGGSSRPLAVGALGGGLVAAVAAAVGWAGGVVPGIPVAIEYLVLAAATGGVLAAMILGHWYLVTPRLSERPLVLVTRLLAAVIAAQLLLFVVWALSGTGGGGRPFAALTGSSALFVWLRLLVGLLFALVVSWMAYRTALSRSMESTTGLLYIAAAAVASGTIVAAGLYYGAGLLV